MLLAYVDESGDVGAVERGGSLTYTLGCVLIDADRWPVAFDKAIAFRRRLHSRFGVRSRDEIKASSLLRNNGGLAHLQLSPAERALIFRAHLRDLAQLDGRAFGVVIDKRGEERPAQEIFDLAWETLLQRLERTSTNENATFVIIHDDGENDRIRRWARRARRHLTAGAKYPGAPPFHNPARLLVDDPVPRNSQHSIFTQYADLVAYAAFRAIVPPGKRIATICPAGMWANLGNACHTVVNRLNHNAPHCVPGIVVRQKRPPGNPGGG